MQPKVVRVLNLWQDKSVFPPDITQQLMVLAGASTNNTENNEDEVCLFYY